MNERTTEYFQRTSVRQKEANTQPFFRGQWLLDDMGGEWTYVGGKETDGKIIVAPNSPPGPPRPMSVKFFTHDYFGNPL